jgi:hypothetical protein
MDAAGAYALGALGATAARHDLRPNRQAPLDSPAAITAAVVAIAAGGGCPHPFRGHSPIPR